MRRNALLFAALIIPSGRPTIEIGGFKLVESREQKKHIEMNSPLARLFKPQEIVALDSPLVKLWGKAKRPYEISGDFGILSSRSDDFTIVATSRVTGPEGLKILTSNLVYGATKQELTTEDNVEAYQLNSRGMETIKITGKGLIIDVVKATYEIKSDVSTEQSATKDNSIVIRSRHAVLSPDTFAAAFDLDVTVSSPEFSLKGETLDIKFASDDKGQNKDEVEPSFTIRELTLRSGSSKNPKPIEAIFSSLKISSNGLLVELDSMGNLKRSRAMGNANGITKDGVVLKSNELISETIHGVNRITLRGEVTIITGDRTATCEEAEFYPENGNIILRNTAAVKKDDQNIEGDIIHFSTKNSLITVERAKGSLFKPKISPAAKIPPE